MECLIPGLILVGLMIYASTRIKRVSAGAFEAEKIETAHFVFEKPEGFLNKIEPTTGLELEGYSREYGLGDAANFRQATYEVTRSSATADAAVAQITASNEVIADADEVVGEKRYRIIAVRRAENGIIVVDNYKISESAAEGVFQLRVSMIEDASADVRTQTETILSRFIVK